MDNYTEGFSFPKSARLSSKKMISELFEKGNSFVFYPIKVFFLVKKSDEWPNTQALFTVSKKRYRKAVDRNTIKRLMREAYRQERPFLINNSSDDISLLIAFIYIGNSIVDFRTINYKIQAAVKKILKKTHEH